MNRESNIEELEAALLERARSLAREYVARGRRSAELIVEDANDKLRVREQREILAARALAERRRKRMVQAGEMRLRADRDRLRWALVNEVLEQVRRELVARTEDPRWYREFVGALIVEAGACIPTRPLVAHLNRRDLERFEDDWQSWTGSLDPRCEIKLASVPIDVSGGILITSHDHDVRLDNTFERRLERMREELVRVILERLFANVEETGVVAGG
jgi:V/A-type H+-transporting ATPase subunit E